MHIRDFLLDFIDSCISDSMMFVIMAWFLYLKGLFLFSSAAYLLKPSNALSIGFGGFIGSSRIEVSDTHERDHTQGVSVNSHSFYVRL
mgnify:FL=1